MSRPVTLKTNEKDFFKVVKSAEGGWELQAMRSGGCNSNGIFCKDPEEKIAEVELQRLVAATHVFEGSCSISSGDMLTCRFVTIDMASRGMNLDYIVSMKDIKKTLEPLKRYKEEIPEVMSAELMWTIVETKMNEINIKWETSPSGSVLAMWEFCNEVCDMTQRLPDNVKGSNQFFSQSIHIIFDYLSNKVLLHVPHRDPRLSKYDFTRDKDLLRNREKLLRRAKGLAKVVDGRINIQARHKLNSSKHFEFYLPKSQFVNATAGKTTGICKTCNAEKLINRVLELCADCHAEQVVWDTSATDADWGDLPQEVPVKKEPTSGDTRRGRDKKTTSDPADSAQNSKAQSAKDNAKGSAKGSAKDNAKGSAKDSVKGSEDKPRNIVKTAEERSTVKTAGKGVKDARKQTIEDMVQAMDKVEALLWAEDKLQPYGVDRDTMDGEWRVQGDIDKFKSTSELEQAEVLKEALWVIRGYGYEPFEAPPPVQPVGTELTTGFSGIAITVKKKKNKKK
eukprot:TRINITY_DN4852_c0_g1_i1.p1 TRINITY_DN4852_c0_g1~~TRINITY_DN4852_c0_g1_i1.p1  ORF type:complete len:508 (+),score=115.68 TRINITY_DN4852_c0_g1_i1:55-1578(+)